MYPCNGPTPFHFFFKYKNMKHQKALILLLVGFGLTAATAPAQSINVTPTGVGIGTTTPATPLHVQTAGVFSSTLTGTSTGPSGLMALRNGNTATGWNFGIETGTGWASGPAGAFYIDQNGVGPRLAITPVGNVGIGTVSPSAKLDVSGDLKAGTVNGEKPPLKFVINPNKETTKYHSILIPGSLVKQYLADGDGGTWKYIFHVISDNTVRIYKEFSYINPEPMPGTTNYYGYSILDNGQERAFILGNGTSYELSSSPWAWIWIRNFKSGSQENNFTGSAPWQNPDQFNLELLSTPNTWIEVFLYDR